MITVETKEGGLSYGFPFLGPMEHVLTVKADISELTTKEVDKNGCVKPGVPFKIDGTLCSGAAGEYVFGVVKEATKIVAPNPTNASLTANTGTALVAVGVIGIVLRGVAKDNMGRDFTANEIAAFGRAGCHLVLSREA